jgi:hypothetical protein
MGRARILKIEDTGDGSYTVFYTVKRPILDSFLVSQIASGDQECLRTAFNKLCVIEVLLLGRTVKSFELAPSSDSVKTTVEMADRMGRHHHVSAAQGAPNGVSPPKKRTTGTSGIKLAELVNLDDIPPVPDGQDMENRNNNNNGGELPNKSLGSTVLAAEEWSKIGETKSELERYRRTLQHYQERMIDLGQTIQEECGSSKKQREVRWDRYGSLCIILLSVLTYANNTTWNVDDGDY